MFDFGFYKYAAPDGAPSANPNGIQIHQPRVERNELPWVTFPKMFSTLKVVASVPPPESTANPTNHAEIKTEIPFAYLACFAVYPVFRTQLLQSCFHFRSLPSVAAPSSRQRWAECCNRVAVGARLSDHVATTLALQLTTYECSDQARGPPPASIGSAAGRVGKLFPSLALHRGQVRFRLPCHLASARLNKYVALAYSTTGRPPPRRRHTPPHPTSPPCRDATRRD